MVKEVSIGNDLFIFSKYLPQADISVNIFLALGEQPILIDTGLPVMSTDLIKKIKSKIALSEIKYVCVTHNHPDHIGGLSDLMGKVYNAKVVAHENLEAYLSFMGVYDKINTVKGGETIDLGERELSIVHAPIETKGYVYFFLDPDQIAFTADYFGQLTLDDWQVHPSLATEQLVTEIKKFHQGLGYTQKEVRKYLRPLEKKDPSLIAPTHGSMINQNIPRVIQKVLKARLTGGEREGKGVKSLGDRQMIYGYLLQTKGGVLIDSWFTSNMKIRESSLATSGITGTHSLYTEITNHPPEYIIGGNLKTTILTKGQLILSIFSTKGDVMAENLARKYLNKVVELFDENEIDLTAFSQVKVEKTGGETLRAFQKEIKKLNRKSQKAKYLREN